MANAVWKRIKKSHPYRRAKLLFKRIAGKELWLRKEIDVGFVCYGNWRTHPGSSGSQGVVYSLVVGKDIDFDLDIIEKLGWEGPCFRSDTFHS